MVDRIPLLNLRRARNWSRIHPFVWIFIFSFFMLMFSLIDSALKIFVIPSLILIAIYGVFIHSFLSPAFK